ncbi:MAG: hypothetical protein ACR2M1_13685 [Gemmatimonadaceae bacterium]
MIGMIRAPFMLAALGLNMGFNLSAFSPSSLAQLVSSPIDAVAARVASSLGGRCWSVASFSVQILGKPMCLAGSGDPAFDAGRGARVAAVKALGMTFAAFSARNGYEASAADGENHIQTFATLIHALLGQAIRLDIPSVLRAQLGSQSNDNRSRYVINDASLDLLASVQGGRNGGGMTLTDPYEAALVARSLSASASLEQATTDVANSLDPRAQSIMANTAGETEGARIQAEAAAARSYLDGARTATRGGAVELESHLTLKRELRAQVEKTVENTILPGVH